MGAQIIHFVKHNWHNYRIEVISFKKVKRCSDKDKKKTQ